MLGNAAPEPFFEDFHDKAFEESQFFFAEQKASALDHFAPIIFSSIM
jgi:hypothetical protein